VKAIMELVDLHRSRWVTRRTLLATAPIAALAAICLVAAACGEGSGGAGSPTVSPAPPQPAVAASAAATAYLEARTQALVQGTPAKALRRLCAPQSGLADFVLWWAAGTRASPRGREIGVPPQGYSSASVKVMVRRVTVDAQTEMANVLAYTTPGLGDSRNVDTNAAFHLVTLARATNRRWLAISDTSTSYEPDLPLFLQAGGASPAVVAAARATERRAKHPGAPPAGSLRPLRAWCAAMNARDWSALKATYTPDSSIQSMTDAQVKTGVTEGSPPHRRDWRVTRMKLLGPQLDGVSCGWVSYRFVSDEPAEMTGSRGFAAFAFLERQADGRWLIFSPPE
jgi:hypothetical protein